VNNITIRVFESCYWVRESEFSFGASTRGVSAVALGKEQQTQFFGETVGDEQDGTCLAGHRPSQDHEACLGGHRLSQDHEMEQLRPQTRIKH